MDGWSLGCANNESRCYASIAMSLVVDVSYFLYLIFIYSSQIVYPDL